MFFSKALCAGALALVLATTSPILAANDPALEAEVDACLQPLLDLDLISGSILIAKGGKILLAKGYGPANREYGIPNTPETKFRLGSMTKQFTAMGILVLADRGKLSLDDPLANYLPDYPNAEKITLHQLLSHTSGVLSYNAVQGYGENYIKPWSIDEVIEWFKDDPLQFEPGEDWAYSNSGYVLLAKVIEVVSGQDYDDFLRQPFSKSWAWRTRARMSSRRSCPTAPLATATPIVRSTTHPTGTCRSPAGRGPSTRRFSISTNGIAPCTPTP